MTPYIKNAIDELARRMEEQATAHWQMDIAWEGAERRAKILDLIDAIRRTQKTAELLHALDRAESEGSMYEA